MIFTPLKNLYRRYFTYLQNSSDLIANYILVLIAFTIPISNLHIKRLFIMLLILAIFTLKQNFTKVKNVILNPLILAYILYFLLNLLWIYIAKDKEDAFFTVKYSIIYLYPILISLFVQYNFIPIIISSFLLAVSVGEIVSYDIYFNYNFFQFLPYINPNANSSSPTPFMSHLNYGLFLAFSAGLSLQLFFKQKTFMLKLLSLLLLSSLTINLFINIGRSGYVLYVISISTVLYFQYKQNILKYFPFILLSFISIFFLAYKFSPNFQNRILQTLKSTQKIYYKNDYMNPIGIRFLNYENSIKLFKEKPLFGYGTHNHISALYKKTKETNSKLAAIIKVYSTTDSQYFDTLLQFGLIGLVIFLNIFYQIYHYRYKTIYQKNISLLIIILFLLYGLQTNFMYFFNTSSILLVFFSTVILKNDVSKRNFNYKKRSKALYLLDIITVLLIYIIAFQIYRLF